MRDLFFMVLMDIQLNKTIAQERMAKASGECFLWHSPGGTGMY